MIFLIACSKSTPDTATTIDKNPLSCAPCHNSHVEEWSKSRHAVAYTNGIFQSEFQKNRPAWCVGCHAPNVENFEEVVDDDLMARQGVGCLSCHVRNGKMVSSSSSKNSPHQTIKDPEFGTSEFCKKCHEFNFPVLDKKGRLLHYTKEPMQETVSQFEQSGLQHTLQCLDCHATTPAGHKFAGSHDVTMLKKAVKLSFCKDDTVFQVSIKNHGAAHHVPSGGVHRHMVLRVWRSYAPEKLFEAFLGRKFRALSTGGKETIKDSTIAPGKQSLFSIEIDDLGPESDTFLNVELRYIYGLKEYEDIPNTVLSRVVFHHRIDLNQINHCSE